MGNIADIFDRRADAQEKKRNPTGRRLKTAMETITMVKQNGNISQRKKIEIRQKACESKESRIYQFPM